MTVSASVFSFAMVIAFLTVRSILTLAKLEDTIF